MNRPCWQRKIQPVLVARRTILVSIPEALYQKTERQLSLLPGILRMMPPELDTIQYFVFPPQAKTEEERLLVEDRKLKSDYPYEVLKAVTCRALQIANGRTYYIFGTSLGGDQFLNDQLLPDTLDGMLIAHDVNPMLQQITEQESMDLTQSYTPTPDIAFTVYTIVTQY